MHPVSFHLLLPVRRGSPRGDLSLLNCKLHHLAPQWPRRSSGTILLSATAALSPEAAGRLRGHVWPRVSVGASRLREFGKREQHLEGELSLERRE